MDMIRKKKQNDLDNVRLSTKLLSLKTWERILTKLKPNEIFNDFAISQDPINKIDLDIFYFKDMH